LIAIDSVLIPIDSVMNAIDSLFRSKRKQTSL